MKNKFSLRSIIVIIVLVIVVFMGGMYFGGRSTPAKEEITSTALTQKIRDINELAVSEYDYTKVGKFSNSLKFNGWTVPLTQKSFLITYEGKLKAGVDLSDVQIKKTENKIIVKTSAVKILSNEIDEDSIKVYDETKNIFNQISITDYKTFAKEQKVKLEVCCGSYEDAINAYHGGAKRIELNSALALGGLTPTIASLELVKNNTDLEVICMVRPRGAGFVYNELQSEQMIIEAEELLEHGADGIAFGFLDPDGKINSARTSEMVSIIHSYGKTAVFHRAFDVCDDPDETIHRLIELGVDRVLTSGMKSTVSKGIQLIKELQEKYGNQIEILAGSGINETNVVDIIHYTGIHQVHSSCKNWRADPTTANDHVSFSYNGINYDYVDKEKVKRMVSLVEED